MPAPPEDPRRFARLTDAIATFLAHDGTDPAAATRLLRENERLRDLLEPMLRAEDGDPGAPLEEDETAERYVGDFRLLREIGRGGMGVVYEAVHVPLGRRVALKVLPAHVTLSPLQVERLRREAAAAARLRHHAIVPIYDVGESDGTHYFSMEFVDGANLATVIADPEFRLNVIPGADRTTQYVEIVARIGDALHYAHDNGVLHRDVKPHNILIGEDGSVRLVDFGLARDSDRHSLSQSDQFSGTPYYASPEQIRGKREAIDSRTDVFSLGVVLYELLARGRPFDGETTQEIFDGIRDRDPPALRRIARRLPNDLCVICHKALEKNPEDRYRTAGEFAADLRRFLRYEPIHAHPPGVLTRIRKAVRRNRLGVIATTSAALLVIGGPLVLWRNAELLHQQQRQHNTEMRGLLSDAMRTLDVSQFRPGSETDFLRRVAELSRRYDRMAQIDASPSIRCDAANVLVQLALANLTIGNNDKAAETYEEGVRRMRTLVASEPANQTFRYGLARQLHGRSLARVRLGDREGSLQDLHAAIEGFEQIDPEGLRPEYRGLPPHALARCYRSLGALHVRPATLEQSRQAFAKSVQLLAEIEDREPTDPHRLDTALVRIDLAGVLVRLGKHVEAKRILLSAIEQIEELRSRTTVHSIARHGLAAAKNHLAYVMLGNGNPEAGIELLRESAGIHACLADDFPKTLAHATNHAGVLRSLAEVVGRDPERIEDALQIADRGLRVLKAATKQSPSSLECQRLTARLLLERASLIRRTRAPDSQKARGFREAAEHLAQLVSRQRDELTYGWLGTALHCEAYWEQRAGQATAALKSIRNAVAAVEQAARIHPGGTYEARLANMRALLARIQGAQTDRGVALRKKVK
ncbi:MAG: serine/threonine protein kinase [Planctomycetes bacterium]|nr:serine/threonine protein kinase [Planctomycetota bacterium]